MGLASIEGSGLTLYAQLFADDEFEPGPDITNRTNLDVYVAHRQGDLSNHVLGDTCRDL